MMIHIKVDIRNHRDYCRIFVVHINPNSNKICKLQQDEFGIQFTLIDIHIAAMVNIISTGAVHVYAQLRHFIL